MPVRKICFFENDICFADKQIIKLNDIKSDLQSNRTFQEFFKWIQNSEGRQSSEAESHFKKEAETLTIRERVIFRVVGPFIPPPRFRVQIIDDAHQTHPRKQAKEMDLRMVALWFGKSQDVERLVSRCEICQKNRPLLGKTVSNWLQTDVWERIFFGLGPHQRPRKPIGSLVFDVTYARGC